MSESTVIDDLLMLGPMDLRAVLSQVSQRTIVAALSGCSPGMRLRLLRNLPSKVAERLTQQLRQTENLVFQEVLAAQRHVVQVMCDLGRTGTIAFDAPEDMVA